MILRIKPNVENNCLDFSLEGDRTESTISLTPIQLKQVKKFLDGNIVTEQMLLSDYGEKKTIYLKSLGDCKLK